ncbi:type I restriction-modification enzyme R subunit C-terminal domain-containing protein [Streptomyces sp. NPDC005393]|uniref:type I restriction-modification enzyme R subunit C-terminal domain-containing protein n=1 Tax=Streptomyces sp. NPDC005393 TaxID=3157041 RepID=UPI0033B9ED3C
MTVSCQASVCGRPGRAATGLAGGLSSVNSAWIERGLTSRQTHFLDLIVDFIAKNGWIRMQHLYKAPFTDRGLIDDFFTDEEIEELRVVFRTLRTRAEPADLAA